MEVIAVVPGIDIWRVALLLVEENGEAAPLRPTMLAEELLAAGDLDGCAEWKRIVATINVIQSADPGWGDKVLL